MSESDEGPVMVNLGEYERLDLPVLRCLDGLLSQGRPPIQSQDAARELDLPHESVARAVRRLAHGSLISARDSGDFGGEAFLVDELTREGRERSGSWPTSEQAVRLLVEAVDDAIGEATGEERETLGRLKEALTQVGTATAANLLAAAVPGFN